MQQMISTHKRLLNCKNYDWQ